MIDDDKVAADEARRIAQHESVKSAVRADVDAEISREAAHSTAPTHAQAERLAESLRHKAVSEVATTESELDRSKTIARASQIVDYIFYLIYGVIGLEVVLNLLGARQSAGFKQFIDAVGAPFLGPFRGLLLEPGIGRFRLMTSYVLALGVYMLLHMAVNGLLRLFVHRKTVV